MTEHPILAGSLHENGSRSGAGLRGTAEADHQVGAAIAELLGPAPTFMPHSDRRTAERYPFARLVHLTPVEEDNCAPCGRPIVVAARSLSEECMGFFHPLPIPHQWMIASLEAGNGEWLGLLLRLTWCRFTRMRWYDSGGEIVSVVESPLAKEGLELTPAFATAGTLHAAG